MKGPLSFGRKREWLARGMLCCGITYLLNQLPARDSLLVLNYHRIGNSEDEPFDSGLFSATASQFDEQIAYLKKHLSPVTLDEALSFVEGTTKEISPRCRVLITLDDGYLDNYEIAYPILRSHGMQGVFFLVTGMVGSRTLPWWDQIAYLVKTAQKRQFSLHYPANKKFNLDVDGLSKSIESILRLYKMPENTDPARFLQELEEEARGESAPVIRRRFLNWDEAGEMIRGGMAIGSHTHSHRVLSQLDAEQQYEELSQSRDLLKKHLGISAEVLSYPVGGRTSFTAQTQLLVRQAGYRAAISHDGGWNLPGKTCVTDIKRNKIVRQSRERFRAQSATCRFSGAFWP
jgi:peptidoglycan/xylan/chitin deacetylase (PgdA/CDA1 family)